MKVELASDDAFKLEHTLASNPMSHLAKDRCTATFTQLAAVLARKPGRAEVIKADKQLKQAKSQCPTPDAVAQVSELRGRATRRALGIVEDERRNAHATARLP
jgi:hypothetical protein